MFIRNFAQFFAQFFAQTFARSTKICCRNFALGNVRRNESQKYHRCNQFQPCNYPGEALKGLYLKVLLSKHRSIACPLPLALASDLPCGICTCKWDLQLLSPGWLWTDFPRPRGGRVTTALGNPFPCGTALGNPFPCRKVCFSQKAPLDKPPLRLPDYPLTRKHCWRGSPCRASRWKKKLFLWQILGAEKTFRKVPMKYFLSGLRGANTFSVAFRIGFRIFFSRFSNRFSYQFKSFLRGQFRSADMLTRKHCENNSWEFFRGILRPQTRRERKTFFTELRVKFVIFEKNYFRMIFRK